VQLALVAEATNPLNAEAKHKNHQLQRRKLVISVAIAASISAEKETHEASEWC